MEEEYRKIGALIDRNDFQTAETLLGKSALPPEARQALEARLVVRRRLRQRAGARKRRREALARRVRKFNRRSWKGLLGLFGGMAGALVFYDRPVWVKVLTHSGGPYWPVAAMDLLGLGACLVMAFFWGMNLLEALLDRRHWSLEGFGGACLAWLGALLVMAVLTLKNYVF